MKQFWMDASKNPLYEDWWMGTWGALLYEGGLYDPALLADFLPKELKALNVSGTFARSVGVGLVNMLSGDYASMNETVLAQSMQNIIDTLFSSFAYPGFFPPSKAFGAEWIDGASVNSLDVIGAIRHCRMQPGVESDSDVVIDVIASQGSNLQRVNASDYRSLAMAYRYLEISSYYSSMNGLERAKFSHPNVTYRYVVLPSSPLPTNYFPLSMNQTQVQEIYDRGVLDGQNAKVGTIDEDL